MELEPAAPHLPDQNTYRASTVLSRTFTLYRRNWLASAAFAALAFAAFDLVDILTEFHAPTIALGIVLTYVAGRIVQMSSDEYHRATTKEDRAAILAKNMSVGRLFGASIVVGLCVVLGLVLLVLPGLLLGTLWILHQPLILREDDGVFESLKNSWDRVKPHLWSTFTALFVIGLLYATALVLYGFVLYGLGSTSEWNETDWQTLVADVLVLSPAFALFPCASAAIYDLLTPAGATPPAA